jgi:two-component system sensor histidine kinase ChvG
LSIPAKKLFKRFISLSVPKITFSGLAKRIFVINLFPLIFFLFLIPALREDFIQQESEELKKQAKGVAANITKEVIVVPGYLEPGVPIQVPRFGTDIDTLEKTVREAQLTTQSRIKVFQSDGKTKLDGIYLSKPVRREDLFRKDNFIDSIKNFFDNLITWYLYSNIPTYGQPEVYSQGPEGLPPEFKRYIDSEKIQINAALSGEVSVGLWRKDSGILMTSTHPITVGFSEQVIGAVQLIKDGGRVEQNLKEQTYEILKYFSWAMGISIFFSIYLWNFIARPLRRLAVRARSIQTQESKTQEIPDFSSRHDEIGDLSKALKEMTEVLSERMDSIKNFSADVAHEIKNPLASVHGAIETAIKVQDQSKKRRLLEILLEDVKRIDRLITDISDASRIDAALSKESRKQVNLVSLLKRVITKGIDERNFDKEKIIFNSKRGLKVYITATEERLLRAFQNILSNAISFTPKKGSIRCSINVVERNQDKVARIMFQDEGPGILARDTEKIFSRFYTQRGEKSGVHSGLGLSIARQIIEAHGGTIVAKNMKNRQGEILGSNFIIEIPMSDKDIDS